MGTGQLRDSLHTAQQQALEHHQAEPASDGLAAEGGRIPRRWPHVDHPDDRLPPRGVELTLGDTGGQVRILIEKRDKTLVQARSDHLYNGTPRRGGTIGTTAQDDAPDRAT